MRRAAVLVVVLGMLVGGCDLPTTGMGILVIDVGFDSMSRTILPEIDMDVTSFTIVGAGPGGADFEVDGEASPVTIAGLAPGSWTLTATGLNGDAESVGGDEVTVIVERGASTEVSMTIRPHSGTGWIEFSSSWLGGERPSVSLSLLLSSDESTIDRTLVPTGASTVSTILNDVPTGYHTLRVRVFDSGYPAAGRVEVIRIVNGMPTHADFAFGALNPVNGTVEVAISTELENPLSVTIDGAAAELTVGESLDLAATADADGATFVWYVDGVSVATGASYTFDGTASTAGFVHRVDVSAFSADGARAGSAGFDVTMVDTPPPPTSFEEAVLQAMNSERGAAGVSDLEWNDLLEAAAFGHSTDMSSTGVLSHTGSDGSDYSARIENAGFSEHPRGELIAHGFPTIEEVVAAWMGSPSHRDILLDGRFGTVGAAEVAGYWTADFGP